MYSQPRSPMRHSQAFRPTQQQLTTSDTNLCVQRLRIGQRHECSFPAFSRRYCVTGLGAFSLEEAWRVDLLQKLIDSLSDTILCILELVRSDSHGWNSSQSLFASRLPDQPHKALHIAPPTASNSPTSLTNTDWQPWSTLTSSSTQAQNYLQTVFLQTRLRCRCPYTPKNGYKKTSSFQLQGTVQAAHVHPKTLER